MGDFAKDAWNYPHQPPLTVEESVQGMIKVVSPPDIPEKFLS
jgi:hypothetical protein